jgi:hypothetical protein
MKFLSMLSSKESLRQMSLQDKDQFLNKLSEDPNLGSFDHIFLMYSYEDGYSPLYSSKIVKNGSNPTAISMCKKFWKNIHVSFYNPKAQKIYKIGFYLPNLNKGFDALTGRNAHVNILDNIMVLNLIFRRVNKIINCR